MEPNDYYRSLHGPSQSTPAAYVYRQDSAQRRTVASNQHPPQSTNLQSLHQSPTYQIQGAYYGNYAQLQHRPTEGYAAAALHSLRSSPYLVSHHFPSMPAGSEMRWHSANPTVPQYAGNIPSLSAQMNPEAPERHANQVNTISNNIIIRNNESASFLAQASSTIKSKTHSPVFASQAQSSADKKRSENIRASRTYPTATRSVHKVSDKLHQATNQPDGRVVGVPHHMPILNETRVSQRNIEASSATSININPHDQLIELQRQATIEIARRAIEKQSMRHITKGQTTEDTAQEVEPTFNNAPFLGQDNTEDNLETQIRSLMTKMREFNAKDPALLARIWEQERRAHIASKSPVPQPRRGSPAKVPKMPVDSTPTTSQAQLTKDPIPPPSQITTLHPTAKRRETLWPEAQKSALIKAAFGWLNNRPENKNNQITMDELQQILHGNPSYAFLCEKIESMGLVVDRGTFARALLAAVPELNPAPNPKGHTQGSSIIQKSPTMGTKANTSARRGEEGPMTQARTQKEARTIVDEETPQSSSLGISQQSFPTTAMIGKKSPQGIEAKYASPYFGHHPPVSNNTSVVSPVSIQRVIELSNNPLDRKPISKEAAARKRNFNEIIDLTLASEDEEPIPSKQLKLDVSSVKPGRSDFTTPKPASLPQVRDFVYRSELSRPVASEIEGSHDENDLLLNMSIIQPLNHRQALRKSAYNVKTIARDVLLATGKHPNMRPLNAHLEGLRLKFKAVDFNSDLSTFRWDLVDPGSLSTHELNALYQREVEDADDEYNEEDELPQSGSRSDIANEKTAASIGGKVDVRTPSPGHVHKKMANGRASSTRHSLSTASLMGESNNGDELNGNGKGKLSLKLNTQTEPSKLPSEILPAKSGTGYSASNTNSPLPKKRGRPVGWRKAIHGSPATKDVTTQATPPYKTSQEQNSQQRRTNSAKEPLVIESRSPSVQLQRKVYKCEWKNCPGQLHNLETLCKHVFKLHNDSMTNGRFRCQWNGCGRKEMVNGAIRLIGPEFPTENEWRDHVDFSHIQPIAWSLGDGPSDHAVDTSDSYLSDTHGRKVTPQARTPSPGSPLLEDRVHQRGPGRPKKKSEEGVAREAQSALTNKKREIGPGLDKGGSRLANEKRRQGFIDDEDFEEVVEKED